MRPVRIAAMAAAGLAAALLAGCTYDYLQRTDRVGYSAGDAVRANLERETESPTRRSMYDTRGLGKDGKVIREEGAVTVTTTTTP